MARWRHAVELAMTDEVIAKLREISRSRTEASSRVAPAEMLLRYAEKPSFGWDKDSGSIIRRYSAASNGGFEIQFTFAQQLTEAARAAKSCLLVISLSWRTGRAGCANTFPAVSRHGDWWPSYRVWEGIAVALKHRI
jgi:hypothetical protein